MIDQLSKESEIENKLNKIFDNISYLSAYVKEREDENKKKFDELKSFFSTKIDQIENRLNNMENNDKSTAKKRAKSNSNSKEESQKNNNNLLLKETKKHKTNTISASNQNKKKEVNIKIKI